MTDDDSDDWMEREQLHFAANDGDLEKVKTLLAQGFPVDRYDDISWTPLHYAAKKEHLDIVALLLAAGADVNARDLKRIGDTPLKAVAATCSFEMAKFLIEAGADPKLPGWMGLTALNESESRKRDDGPRVHALLLKASEGGLPLKNRKAVRK